MNYFAKTVYSIATKTCPLAVYRRFSQAKREGAKMCTFEKWGHGPLAPRFRRHWRRLQTYLTFHTLTARIMYIC